MQGVEEPIGDRDGVQAGEDVVGVLGGVRMDVGRGAQQLGAGQGAGEPPGVGVGV